MATLIYITLDKILILILFLPKSLFVITFALYVVYFKMKSMLQALKDLESEYDDQFDSYLNEHSCEDQCCENWKKEKFLVGLINAGYLMYSQQSMGLGTFLSKFANLTNAIINERDHSYIT